LLDGGGGCVDLLVRNIRRLVRGARRRRLHLSVRCGDKQKPRGDQHHGSGTVCEDLHRLPPARCDRLRKEREYSAACKRHPQEAVPGHRAIEACHEHMSCSAGTIVRRGELDDAWPHHRLLSHLLNVTTQAMDVGALTPPLWGFEEREKLMVFYERASGSRLHANYFRVGGVHRDLPPKLLDDIWAFCDPCLKVCDDIEGLLTDNRIFKQRNVDVGVVTLADAWAWGFSGVMVRGS